MSRSEVRGPDARELSSSRAYSFAHAGTACIRAAVVGPVSRYDFIYQKNLAPAATDLHAARPFITDISLTDDISPTAGSSAPVSRLISRGLIPAIIPTP